MSRSFIFSALILGFVCVTTSLEAGWKTKRLHETFYTEDAAAGDIDGDGQVDIVAGPLWFKGPDFEQSFEITAPKQFPVSIYSDNFFSAAFDANADGADDVLVIGFPGQAAILYLNPGKEGHDKHWPRHEIAPIVDNESPRILDFIKGGLPEIVCGREGRYGFYQANEDATQPWAWHPVTKAGACGGRFAHGLGVGDVNKDGRLDLLDKTFWWEQPEQGAENSDWKQRQWALENYGGGGAQIHVDDIDGDGDQDILTSLNAHGYGLGWFEQTSPDRFVQHPIMGQSSQDNDFGVSFSQLHAVDLVDMNGDGRKDIVTGKRWMAHNGKDPGGLQEPVLYWFESTVNGETVEFVPHEIDRDSGVGVDVLVTDLNGDQRPDIVSSSKRGLTVHWQDETATSLVPQRWKLEEGRDQSKYAEGYAPEEAARNMLVDQGFAVDLIAAEPDVTQPVAMCFDARGRLWVVEGHTYPTRAPEGEGRDRIVIFEDADANGTFESRKVFLEGLNLVSGIEIGFGGVWIGAAPYLMFVADENRDDVPDSEPQILLDGWGYQDTHETLNSFTWGPDGWLYGCQGVFTHSNVGKPGAKNEDRSPLNACVWRYHPTRHEFEVYAHGSSNPWGVDFNDQGEWFISACVIPHLYHIQQGARYQRQAGQHFNPHTYDDIKTIADHAHYAGNIRDHAFWGMNRVEKRYSPVNTSVLGGGHAHCGLAFYNADQFPREYYGDLLFHNLHGHRVVRESLEKNGSGFIGKHSPDFALSRDHKQIGVTVLVGPDGSIYTSDWHDVQTCHNRNPEIWDRTDGRLYRIRYGELEPNKIDLWSDSDAQLTERLQSDNGFIARQAQRILHERAVNGNLNKEESGVVSTLFNRMLNPETSQRDRLRALWTLWCIDQVDEEVLQNLLSNSDEYMRGWAVHFVGEQKERSPELLNNLAELARRESSPVVRRYLASLLQKLPLEQRWPILEALVSHHIDERDPNQPYLIWYALEPLAESHPDRAYDVARQSRWGSLFRFTVRRSTATPQGRDRLSARLADVANKDQHLLILEELNSAIVSRGGVEMPPHWPDAFQQLKNNPNNRIQELTRAIAVQVGDENVYPYFRSILSEKQKSKQQRLEALTALRTAKDPELPQQLYSLMQDQTISAEAVAALAEFPNPETPEKILALYDSFTEATKTAALSTLVSRPTFAAALVTAMEKETIKPDTVPAFIIRQAVALKNEELNKRLENTWGQIAESSAEKAALYEKYRAILKPEEIAKANASQGRALYVANCGKCHELFGEGGKIGPGITGANRTSVDYWLENILEPNSLIGKAYQVTSIQQTDGRVVSGIIQEENDDAITVQTATEKVVIARKEIEEVFPSNISLMPEGQLRPMTNQQVLDLIKYLTGPSQVPLPE